MAEVSVCVGNKSPEVVDTIDMVIDGLEKDWRDGVGETDNIIIGGLSIDGEEKRLGCCKGCGDGVKSHGSRMGKFGVGCQS